MNLYGFAGGDPVNFSDPFGLCTIKDWTDCKFLSFTAGAGLGIGASGSLGPVSIEGKVGKAGVDGSLSEPMAPTRTVQRLHRHFPGPCELFRGSLK